MNYLYIPTEEEVIIEEGVMTLMDAVKKYENSKHKKFAQYQRLKTKLED